VALNETHTTYFARENFRGNRRVFGIRAPDRRLHMYVIGKTGTGKTTLLKNLAIQDINNGKGVAIVDPHGEFVEEVLNQIPKDRIDDVIYFNPADMEYPIGFNVLEVSDPKYKHLVASDLMGIFTKIWANVWSARMEYILHNCVLALLDAPDSTLLGIPRILVDKDYRRKVLANVKDPVVRSFWVHEYENYNERFRSEAIAPIQNKVGQFLNTTFIRNIVGQKKSTINIPDIMNKRKIFLVNVSKGRIGENNSRLLGAMVITKLQLAAMERVRISENEREDFYLYVDEFQNFATDSFASILSEARKYRLNLIIAHQYIGQLVTEQDTKVRDAVFGNVGTLLIFRVGAADAEFLEKEFTPEFTIEDLVNLPNREIYLKLMVDGVTCRPFSASTLPPIQIKSIPDCAERIMLNSRRLYSRDMKEVEEEIHKWSGGIGDENEESKDKEDGEKQYIAKCAHCGKQAKVPYKPDGRRPVYCTSCFKKVNSGELSSIPARKFPKKSDYQQYGASLGALGIEFEDDVYALEDAINSKKASKSKRFPGVSEGSYVVRQPVEETLSLHALSNKQSVKLKRRNPNLPGLRDVLRQVWKGEVANGEKEQSGIDNSPTKGSVVEKEKGGAKLRPGEKVRLT